MRKRKTSHHNFSCMSPRRREGCALQATTLVFGNLQVSWDKTIICLQPSYLLKSSTRASIQAKGMRLRSPLSAVAQSCWMICRKAIKQLMCCQIANSGSKKPSYDWASYIWARIFHGYLLVQTGQFMEPWERCQKVLKSRELGQKLKLLHHKLNWLYLSSYLSHFQIHKQFFSLYMDQDWFQQSLDIALVGSDMCLPVL